LLKRTKYLNKIIANLNNEFIKVITGVRRSGKSVLLMQTKELILEQENVTEDNIIYLNFESFANSVYYHDKNALYQYLTEHALEGQKNYFIFDEIQLVDDWQIIVNSLRVDFDADIYLTGSNASILSGELATLLSGRYIKIDMMPLSFKEYLEMQNLDEVQQRDAAYRLYGDFRYIGGMPSVVNIDDTEFEKINDLSDIYDSILLRDVSSRANDKNTVIIRTIALLLMDSISSEVNVTKLNNRLNHAGFNLNATSIRNYLDLLEQAYLFYKVGEVNIRGSQRLRTNDKYYMVDNGLWNSQIDNRNTNLGNQLENIVLLELLRRGYDVKYGKIDDKEIDFVAAKRGKREYFQVALEMPQNSNREIDNLLEIQDNYPKTLITGNDLGVRDIQGVAVTPIYEWLLEND
jgi:predicted AAA+ superfamily ATPase